MDQASRSSEPPESAATSEPCSTRPNPFEDDLSSRKRRRTSMSGSRSISVDSARSVRDLSSSTTVDMAEQPMQDPSSMKLETEPPSAPKTPDLQSATAELPSEPSSSKVTINLRHKNPPPVAQPLSSLGNTATAERDPEQGPDDVKTSVEDPEIEMGSAPLPTAVTPQSSSSDMGSPDIEVIAIPDDDEEVDFVDSEVSIIGEGNLTLDPTENFPYHDAHRGESLADTANRLREYMSGRKLHCAIALL
jgi:ubiquitin carboxyl-terminal hydrolase 34